MAKLETLCLPFSNSLSSKKCLYVFHFSLKPLSSTSHITCAKSTFWAPEPLSVPYSFRLCSRKLKRLWKSLSHILLGTTRAVALGCFLAMWFCLSARDFVGKLGHGVQNNLPAEQLFLWRARFSCVVWVPPFSQFTFSLPLTEIISV